MAEQNSPETPETPETSEPNPGAAEDKKAEARAKRLGKANPKAGGTVWDDEALDPNKRKSIAEDPEGKANKGKAK